MYSGVSGLYNKRVLYCVFKVMYDNCKWWQFKKKRAIQEQIDFFYPLMKAEVNLDEILSKMK